MPKRGPSRKRGKTSFLEKLLGVADENETHKPPSGEQKSPEEIDAARIKENASWLEFLKREAGIYWLSEDEFHGRMRAYARRLGIVEPNFSPFSSLWMKVVADLITLAPEFRRPRARPKTAKGKGGMAYDRYRAVLAFRREHPDHQSASQVEIIRTLQKQEHPLFANYDEATLVKEVSRGKSILEKAKAEYYEMVKRAKPSG